MRVVGMTEREWIATLSQQCREQHTALRPLAGIEAVDKARAELWAMHSASEEYLTDGAEFRDVAIYDCVPLLPPWFRFVPHRRVAEFLARGWVVDDDLRASSHGEYSVLMRWEGLGEPE